MIIKTLIGVFLSVGLLYYFFPIIEVCGISMFPTYRDNEFIIGTRLFRKRSLKIGDVVMYHPPNGRKRVVIKRIHDIDLSAGVMFCVGDNEDESYDSRDYGFVSLNRIVCIPIKQRKQKER